MKLLASVKNWISKSFVPAVWLLVVFGFSCSY